MGFLAQRKIPRFVGETCRGCSGAQIRCVVARSETGAEELSRSHAIVVVHDSYIDVINNDAINAVYIPLPISTRHEWPIKAHRAGKYVLCEKSYPLNVREAKEMSAVGIFLP